MTYNGSGNSKSLIDFYDKLVRQYGPYSAQSIGWSDRQAQDVRFSVLAEIGDLSNKSILDVGCGFGDLYLSLKNKFKTIDYSGIDIVPSVIKVARQKYPDLDFIQLDFNQYQEGKSDYTLASGALSYWVENYKEFYFGMIQTMFNTSKIATGFNMLDSRKHPCDNLYATYTIPEVYKFCSGLTQKIIIRQDYLPHDFTFFLYH